MTEYGSLTFDWASPPLTANQRLHWAQKAKITAKVRESAARLLRNYPPVARVEVTLTWVVHTKHRRDVDNVVPTLKALCDGIVDAGIVPDDTAEFMDKLMPVIRYDATADPHLILEIREVD